LCFSGEETGRKENANDDLLQPRRLLPDQAGRREEPTRRKSRSSVILSILEEYLESQKRLGEILVDLGVLSHSELAKGLELQKTRFTDKLLGDILLEEELVAPEAVKRALVIQGRHREASRGV
jgi:hypothetical protein